MKRSNALTLVATLAVLAGCSSPIPPAGGEDAWRGDTGPRDTGTDANVQPSTDGATDAVTSGDAPSGDASSIDGASSSDASMDASSVDAAVDDAWSAPDVFAYDAGPPSDGYGCTLPDGGVDVCGCGMFGADCSASACPTGQTCTSDACGRHCAPRGSPCASSADCPATSTCDATGHCAAPGTGCADSRDCPSGFACESSACVDRRAACGPGGECPIGYLCAMNVGVGICTRLSRHCASSTACGSLPCVDITGTGSTECNFGGGCLTNADCHGTGVCEPRSLERFSQCGRYGPCATVSDCMSGMQCRDLWGDGVLECVDTGGTCTRTADCSTGSVCATPWGGGPPTCIATG
jgi:hypothetical protein